jgi:hypothetical protein
MAASGQKGMYVNMNSGAVQAYLPPFRNALINGDMRINQRVTSSNLASLTAVATTTPGSFVTDRWNVYRPGFAAGASIGQGIGMTYSDIPFAEAGITTYGRIGRTATTSATTAIHCDYNMESQDSYRLVGKQVTLSFYYRNGVNFSDNFLTATLYSGTGTDQPLRSGTFTSFATTAFAKSSSWVRATVTGTVPTSAAQVCLRFSYTPVGTAGNADNFDITGVQLELGSVATLFEVRPFPVELATCQRYYQKSYGYTTAPGTAGAGGQLGGFGTTPNFMWAIPFQVNTRIIPTGGTSFRTYGFLSGTIDKCTVGGGTTNYNVNYGAPSEKGVSVFVDSGVSNNYYYIHYTIDIEL